MELNQRFNILRQTQPKHLISKHILQFLWILASSIIEQLLHRFLKEQKRKIVLPSLKLTANAPENRPKPNRKVVFQPSIFRGELLVSGRVDEPFQ